MRSSLTSLEDSPSSTLRLPLWDRASAEFCFAKSRELLCKPFLTKSARSQIPPKFIHACRGPLAPHNSCRDINTVSSQNVMNNKYAQQQKTLEKKLLDLNLDDRRRYHYSPQYRDRTLTKSDSMSRKVYTSNYPLMSPDVQKAFPERFKLERNRSFLHETGKYMCSPVTSPPYWTVEQNTTPIYPDNFNYNNPFHNKPLHYQQNKKNAPEPDNFVYESAFVPVGFQLTESTYGYENGSSYAQDISAYDAMTENRVTTLRPRALSFTDNRMEIPRKLGKSIRDRNLRRQSYNPQVYESSSSESDECTSLGSAVHSDLELRRRRRTSSSAASRLSTSNSSIRSELIGQWQERIKCNRIKPNQLLKPDLTVPIKMGKSPPPSQSALSGLSPTTVARWQHDSESSSDSSL